MEEEKNDEVSSNNTWGDNNLLGKEQLVASTNLSGLGLTNGNSFFQTSTTNQTNNSLSSLTDDDWKWLAYAVSGEAALGTDEVTAIENKVTAQINESKTPTVYSKVLGYY